MFGSSKKPFSAVTVHVERLTSEEYEENDVSGIPELIEAIKLQDSGPREASRAIRKKLKYGNVHRQLRALTILDALIGNAGIRFQRSFADEPLLERLRVAATDIMTDQDVKAKIKVLFGQWAVAYKDTQGLGSIANLYMQLPQRRRPRPPPQALRETSPDHDKETESPRSVKSGGHSSTRGPSSGRSPVTIGQSVDFPITTTNQLSKSQHKKPTSKSKNKTTPFNLEKEKTAMLQSLAGASVAATNLKNALKLINRETERPSQNTEVVKRFNDCKHLRRSILRFIQNVESEQWLGGLIHANEELVEALTLYDVLDKPIEEDSDSEDDWNTPPEGGIEGVSSGMAKLGMYSTPQESYRPAMPPRPAVDTNAKGKEKAYKSDPEVDEDDDPDNPFGDNHRMVEPEEPGRY